MNENEWDDIKINKRSTNKVYFESTFIQQVSDGIDFLRKESREILEDLDKKGINDFDLEEFSQETLNKIDDIVDDMDEFKSEIIDDEIPEFVKNTSRNAKLALNRDQDYVRKAKRRLDRINSKEDIGYDKANLRVIELCDKAIDVNDSNYMAYYLKGQALINIGKYDGAIDELIRALSICEDFWDAWLLIGDANRLNLDFDDALSVYDKVLSCSEDSFGALIGKAMTYYDMNDYEKAKEYFTKAKFVGNLEGEALKVYNELFF